MSTSEGSSVVSTSLPLTTETFSESTMTSIIIGAVVGGVAGSLFVLSLVLALVCTWMTKKYKLKAASLCEAQCNQYLQKLELDGSGQRKAARQQHGDEVMEMESNDAYIATT